METKNNFDNNNESENSNERPNLSSGNNFDTGATKRRRTAVIVGASSGIGLETARLFAHENYNVINIARSPAPEGIVDCNILADASVDGSLTDAINQAVDFGQNKNIDTFVYCAGYSLACPIQHAFEGDYRYLFDVNFFGIVESLKAVIPFMKEVGGRIVLVSSLAGTIPLVFDSFYCASKAAVDSLAESADIELRPYGIRVCAIRPGGVATNFTFKRKVYEDSEIGEYARRQHKAVASLAKVEQNGMDAKRVAQVILDVTNAKNPPVKKVVGFANQAAAAVTKVLPDGIVSFINNVRQ
ncbi:MAG: SDR family NAD(P)-dependent oxidoreductase [Firmicutes bacterium]|nr:SDR family NAD(P)-dependent oxidoreductase [Bacillota bacterium]